MGQTIATKKEKKSTPRGSNSENVDPVKVDPEKVNSKKIDIKKFEG